MSQHEREGRLSDAGAADRTAEQIEHEIEHTRERMSSNIDALGEKLRPDNLKRQAKQAIAEKAQDVVAGVGDQARQTGTRMFEIGTSNPLAIAAASLGAVWLFSRTRARIPVALAAGAVLAGLALAVLLPEAEADRTARG